VPLLQARNLCKSYDTVPVLHSVDFDLEAGEVHALLGENGAGKSTLCRILCGLTSADSGTMQLNGQPHAPRSRRQAEHAGVRIVTQELNLLPTLTVAENIFLDSLPRRFGFVDYRRLNREAQKAIDQVGLQNVSPSQPLSYLGVGQCQLVEIASALSGQCRVLILDEPTAALTGPEIELLFTQIRRLKSQGVGILYVSHRMDEIRAITDRLTILRDGRLVATHRTDAITHDQIVREMVGREISHQPARREARAPQQKPIVLRIENLSSPRLHNINLSLHSGEILGVAGLMGSGRTELLRAIFHADVPDAGRIYLRNSSAPTRLRSPTDAVKNGIGLLTEDRKSQGLLLPLSIVTNTTLPHLSAVSRLGFINPIAESRIASNYIDQLRLRCRSPHQPAKELSGGNQQKVVLAKWLLRDCDILLFDEPTRGIDVGAKLEIYQLLQSLAQKGKALLVVSSDLPELMAISDRIAALSNGCLAATFDRADFSQEKILAAALSHYVRRM